MRGVGRGESGPPPESETPTAGETAGADGQALRQDGQEAFAPSGEKTKVISDLTDIPTIREYLNRIGAVPRGLYSAVVQEKEGRYWRDLATVHFNKENGEVDLDGDDTEAYKPNDLERQMIAAAVKAVKWPELKKLHSVINPPALVRDAAPENIFEFRDADGQIIMLQVRVAKDDGKFYLSFTYWSDDKWRMAEPEGLLPLYGQDKIGDNAVAFIHEGAKAARHMQWMVEAADFEAKKALAEHPWGQQLTGAVHLGWIGGAPNPHRTDWSALHKHGVTRVYIVNDNDVVGREAVPKIARLLSAWEIAVENICVSEDKFEGGWDLADPMPADARGEYIGEPMMSYAVPATWLTQKILTGEKGRPTHVLRRVATQLIVPIRDQECFGYWRNGILRQASQLNKAQAPFSDVDDSARLFWKDYTHGSVDGVTYCPAEKKRIVQEGDSRKFNTYTPSPVEGEKGDLAEWQEYLTYMFPLECDRREVERWLATLIGRPDVRLTYSLLLISTRQGKGKSTLLDTVLRPLVGMSNSALVKSSDMKTGFNGWAAGKRLVVCHEIYEGRNKSLADSLKSVMVDARISINEKYEKEYELPNWTTFAACSNSRRAVHIDNKDRRWFIPDIDEHNLWPRARFAQFRAWLKSGGLRAIKYWAEPFESEFSGKYVKRGAHAPASEAKLVSIEENLSEGARAVLEMAEALAGYEERDEAKPGVVAYPVLCALAREAMKGCQDTDAELLAVAEGAGLTKFKDSEGGDRVKVGGVLRRFLINDAAKAALAACTEGPDVERAKVREWAQGWLTTWHDERSRF